MSLIRRVPWTVQPQYAAKVKTKYCPLYGLQPGGFGLLDTSGTPLTNGGDAGLSVARAKVVRFPLTVTGYLRSLSASATYPLTLVFRGVNNQTGIRCPTSLASGADKLVRLYCNNGPISAQHAGGTTAATATTSSSISAAGVPFTAVCVFASATDVRIYGSGSAGRGSASSSTNIGTLPAIDRLAYGQYYGASAQYEFGGDIELAQWLNVSLTAAEAWALVDNPWQIFQSPPIDIWVPSAGGAPTFIPGWALGSTTTIGGVF